MATTVDETAKALMDTAPMGFDPEQAEYVAKLLLRLHGEIEAANQNAADRIAEIRQQEALKQRELDKALDMVVELRIEKALFKKESNGREDSDDSGEDSGRGNGGATAG